MGKGKGAEVKREAHSQEGGRKEGTRWEGLGKKAKVIL